jgi:hypothetical protein
VAKLQADIARWQDEIVFRDKLAALQTQLDAAAKTAAERETELQKADEQLAAAKSSADAAAAKLNEANSGLEKVQAEIRQARGLQ